MRSPTPMRVALMRDHRAAKQSAIYGIGPAVFPPAPGQHPSTVGGYAVYGEFFPMLDVPFLYGRAGARRTMRRRHRWW